MTETTWYHKLTYRMGIMYYGDWRDPIMRVLLFVLHPIEHPCASRTCIKCGSLFFLSGLRAWPLINRFARCRCGGRTRYPTDRELLRQLLLN